jgi:hypothetical protein
MALFAAAALAGCGGYSAWPDGGDGNQPLQLGGYSAGFLQPKDINSVYVQVFASQEYRRELEFRLTESLVKRILNETPYKIAKQEQADSILTGEVRTVPVTNLGNAFDSDLPMEVQLVMVVDWTWKNRRTGEIIAQQRGMQQAGEYLPYARETFYDGSAEAINDLAKRIVEGMEAAW